MEDIKELMEKEINKRKKERLLSELMDLSRLLEEKKRIGNNLKELFDIEMNNELLSFLGGLNLRKYDLLIEINSSGNVGIGTTEPGQSIFYVD